VEERSKLNSILEGSNLPLWLFRSTTEEFRILCAPSSQGLSLQEEDEELIAVLPAVSPSGLGSASFLSEHNVRYAYIAGAMANGIASEDLVIAMGKAQLLSFFGAGGLHPRRVEQAIQKIQRELKDLPYGFNLLHNPFEPSLEESTVELYLKYGVQRVSASAYLGLTPYVVHYRLKGLYINSRGQVEARNHIFAKVSRSEVARAFMAPAPLSMVEELLNSGKINTAEAELSQKIPMASDITAEADSGGHTDQRPLVTMLPTFLNLRDQAMNQYQYQSPIRVGCGGGISTPQSVIAAFSMGAAYVLTGSVNQMCKEAGTSQAVKVMLANMEPHDVIMAPAADMFEMGVKLQVLRKGSMFPMRSQKLYQCYQNYSSLEEIPQKERHFLEAHIFQKSLEEVWNETVEFFTDRDPSQLEKAKKDPKHRMALVFRWYLGKSSLWAIQGDPDRKMDYQVWAGPATGAFNEWAKGTPLESIEQRTVTAVAEQLMSDAASLSRVQNLKTYGVPLPETSAQISPSIQEKQ
jgi:PfaD family protein